MDQALHLLQCDIEQLDQQLNPAKCREQRTLNKVRVEWRISCTTFIQETGVLFQWESESEKCFPTPNQEVLSLNLPKVLFPYDHLLKKHLRVKE